ncbi:hypothetical protein N5D53_13070 [Pseudomonas sp. GD03862]|uniref:hypothetical protein n=1 Tax=Pseudomonas sp. GD03862 TaxID=2975391 RepID=UPI00244CB965|nr:hypothetical protein [Pseudomonas sp. GD03862]MDH0707449.1 hypothetical protein [Pseudomonas sp. GD03862]
MHNDDYSDPLSIPADQLPPGVFPPMPGYTIADLLNVAYQPTETLLEKLDIDPGLIRETSIAFASHLYQALERDDIQYQIATWYQKPYDHPEMRVRSVEIIAEQFGIITIEAVADSLEGSPLRQLGKDFFAEYIELAGCAIKNHILKLNDPEFDPFASRESE